MYNSAGSFSTFVENFFPEGRLCSAESSGAFGPLLRRTSLRRGLRPLLGPGFFFLFFFFFFSPVALASAITSIIALASATGKKKKKKKKKSGAKEGPKAPTQARSTEEEAEGPKASDDSG